MKVRRYFIFILIALISIIVLYNGISFWKKYYVDKYYVKEKIEELKKKYKDINSAKIFDEVEGFSFVPSTDKAIEAGMKSETEIQFWRAINNTSTAPFTTMMFFPLNS